MNDAPAPLLSYEQVAAWLDAQGLTRAAAEVRLAQNGLGSTLRRWWPAWTWTGVGSGTWCASPSVGVVVVAYVTTGNLVRVVVTAGGHRIPCGGIRLTDRVDVVQATLRLRLRAYLAKPITPRNQRRHELVAALLASLEGA